MNTIAHDGTTIAWSESGDLGRPAIVLLHSLGSNRDMWRPQIAVLSERFRVISIDTRGHGESEVTPGPYSLSALGADVLAVADAVGLDRFHVCGLSLGGQMALWLGVNHPQRISTVTAANTGAKIGDETSWGARIEAIREGGMSSIREAAIERWFSPDFASRHPDWYAAAGATFDRTEPEGYIGCCTALAGADLRDSIGSIEAPTLVIGSTLDVSTPPAQAEWIHERIRGSELTIIDDAGHVSNLDRADIFTERLTTFLDRS